MVEPGNDALDDDAGADEGMRPETPTGVPPVPGPPPGLAEEAGEDEPPISPAVLNPE
jgi:hypothetical protein